MVALLEDSPPSRVSASLSRDGIEVYGDFVNMQPLQTRDILLQVEKYSGIKIFQIITILEKWGGGGGFITKQDQLPILFQKLFYNLYLID